MPHLPLPLVKPGYGTLSPDSIFCFYWSAMQIIAAKSKFSKNASDVFQLSHTNAFHLMDLIRTNVTLSFMTKHRA